MNAKEWLLLIVVGTVLTGCSGAATGATSDESARAGTTQHDSNDSPYPDLIPDASVEGFGTFENFVEAPWADDFATGFDSLWLANGKNGQVSRLDLETDETTATIEVGDPTGDLGAFSDRDPVSMAVSDEGIWVTNRAAKSLALIDPTTDQITREVPIDAYGYDLAVDGDLIWVTDPDSKTLLRVNTVTSEVEAVIELDHPVNITIGGGYIWVSQPAYEKVTPIDPATNEVLPGIVGLHAGIVDILFAEDSLWVSTTPPAGLRRIDPVTHEELARIKVEAEHQYVWQLAYGQGSIWWRVGLTNPGCDNSSNFIARIDPGSNTETSRMYLNCVQNLFVSGDTLWAQLTPIFSDTPIARISLNP